MYDFPKSGLEAKFSIQYWVAAALVYGKLDLPEITDRAIQNPKIQRLLSITTAVASPELGPGMQPRIRFSRGAEQILIECGRGKGSPDDPMSVDEINRKFIACAEWGGLSPEKAQTIADIVMHLDECDNLKELMRHLS
jgi:2-methylcitrate dehydratase PrpD